MACLCRKSRILLCALLLVARLSSVLVSAVADPIPEQVVSGIGAIEGCRKDFFREILRDEAVTRLNELGKISDDDGFLQRTFLSPGSLRANSVILGWMQDAGLRTWVDQMGNVHGRVESTNSSASALLIGSHLDTVVDAGKFDGALGIVCAIAALKVLKSDGRFAKLQRPVEVIAFSDEEGVRFQSTFLGSAAIAGTLPVSALQISDKSGFTVEDVLKLNSIQITEESFLNLKYDAKAAWGYIEVHIEQGPVLERLGYPLGVVEGIAGQTRLRVTVRGTQGHAGTVPMSMRQDPMAGAAELIVLLENLCKHPENFITYDGECGGFTTESLAGSVVCTVGEISCWPGASNVIPGEVTFTVDLRARDDMAREAILYELSNRIYQTCGHRSVSCTIERKHDAGAVHCDQNLTLQLKSAAEDAVKRMAGDVLVDVPVLMSGAGHDAMAMSHLTRAGMLFVRCRGGISHSPEEHVLDEDIWAAGLALVTFLEANLLLFNYVCSAICCPLTGLHLGTVDLVHRSCEDLEACLLWLYDVSPTRSSNCWRKRRGEPPGRDGMRQVMYCFLIALALRFGRSGAKFELVQLDTRSVLTRITDIEVSAVSLSRNHQGENGWLHMAIRDLPQCRHPVLIHCFPLANSRPSGQTLNLSHQNVDILATRPPCV
ncbi:hypothetical protein H6P81_019203 [Aristolochia fimbriata]|uniref:allantoate deiminase n=1 Tax=Aristolochia fimbriata TaxID=158543 RepID=A0AAV7DVR7_ARIFI|nr:hypothetical protein H6P81_019203 [Aristolochia fimbriata]